jgi:hypothetical protein
VPFTPVAGQRILVPNTPYKDQVFDALVKALKSLTTKVSYFKVYFKAYPNLLGTKRLGCCCLEFQITVQNILWHVCPAVYQFGLVSALYFKCKIIFSRIHLFITLV